MAFPNCSPPAGPGTSAKRAANPAAAPLSDAEAADPGATTDATLAAAGAASPSVPNVALVITRLASWLSKLHGCE